MFLKTKPERIMVYIDASEESIIAAQFAVCIAKWLECEVTAVYVVDVKTLKDLTTAKIFIELEEVDYEKDLEEDGKRYLDHVKEIADSKGIFVETILLKGEIFGEVIDKIEQEEYDLLIMGELEEPESRRDFYYNDNERIFRRAPCPVIIVKNPEQVKTMYENL